MILSSSVLLRLKKQKKVVSYFYEIYESLRNDFFKNNQYDTRLELISFLLRGH